ncbi:Ribosomal protein lysine methyltransferase [Didymosphaeria variabile]|uniref:Ribosomal protein lysine methyltransferase n=1 Tax=Didymosphaeria variabile TaxID=1932322 RepID=A0A9W9CGB9_9PLEO|nr:Ribosomal protein lysine methyltransferase [Didymosphaeria variabile]KAJ4360410.1 Ribosomal protein lysine methyltransferase [Didymosphaeria variabile]
MSDLFTLLGDPVTDPEEESFVVFSHDVPSQQSLGFIDSQAAEIEISIGGRDLTIRQSRGLLTSDRKEGTTGAVVWKVTPLFAEWIASPNFLSKHGFLGSDNVAIELGAGVSGLVALTLGPKIKKYIATDQDYVIRLLKRNIAENLPTINTRKPKPKKKTSHSISESVCGIETLELDWELNSVSSLPSQLGLSGEGAGFDLVIACDCIYNESLIEPLNSTCAQICKLRSLDGKDRPTLCLVAQQLRSHEVFEAWLKSFNSLFKVWQVPDALLTAPLRVNSGFIVHIGVVR